MVEDGSFLTAYYYSNNRVGRWRNATKRGHQREMKLLAAEVESLDAAGVANRWTESPQGSVDN